MISTYIGTLWGAMSAKGLEEIQERVSSHG